MSDPQIAGLCILTVAVGFLALFVFAIAEAVRRHNQGPVDDQREEDEES